MKRRRKGAIVFILLIIIAVVVWLFLKSDSAESTTDIASSGFIEARDVAVSLETGGRIVEIAADEGDRVSAGVTLVKLDDSLLLAQKQQAEANVNLAMAYLEQAQVTKEGAMETWLNALDVQRNPLELDAKIIAAEGELESARLNMIREKEIDSDLRVPAAETRLDTAEKLVETYRGAEHTVGFGSQYDRKANTLTAEGEMAQAELNLSYQQELQDWSISNAETRYETSLKALENLLAIKENPQEIDAAVDQAYAAHQTAIAAVKAAERQVEQVQASLNIIEVQLDKLSTSSPLSGVVAARNAEVGEIIQPGAPILTITELEEVTLTTYVPESKIGLVKVGQEAVVTVDSYPEESFIGNVVYISPQAVFTPRNIQLKEERERMVFAVKVRLDNPEQKLKSGMPADASIKIDTNG